MTPQPTFAVPPYRLSGVVYGTLLNDPATVSALGDAVHAAPYKAPPKAPVLYLQPRHTLAGDGAAVAVPAEGGALEIGATLGLVIGRTACRVTEADALAHVAGGVLVADLCIPHSAFYRPSVRLRARDGSCVLGPVVAPLADMSDPNAVELTVRVDGKTVQTVRLADMVRPAARLLQDVTEFMTLRPGDLLLLGLVEAAPQVGAGQRFSIEAPGQAGLGHLEGHLVAEAAMNTEAAA
ncbi:MAG: fumarylacetoacetate hydrolase family protein [Burkholderiaceae bacterium]|nr:fumarylacetoacetate hydrolase family protein [Rhodoferax sp.]MCP5285655.1 fumarylacetoacetate hydrolase family protein [Burkholderiaceae bacterium]